MHVSLDEFEPERLKVLSIYKPVQAIVTATATVQVIGSALVSEVIDVGLHALGESREGLFGYGVKGHRVPTHFVLPEGTYTVYALRD